MNRHTIVSNSTIRKLTWKHPRTIDCVVHDATFLTVTSIEECNTSVGLVIQEPNVDQIETCARRPLPLPALVLLQSSNLAPTPLGVCLVPEAASIALDTLY